MESRGETRKRWLNRLLGAVLLSASLFGIFLSLLLLSGNEYIAAFGAFFLSILVLLCSLPLLYFGDFKIAAKYINAILNNFRIPD
jgi:predicted signal transduction protein with EAL and GGDEF domain